MRHRFDFLRLACAVPLTMTLFSCGESTTPPEPSSLEDTAVTQSQDNRPFNHDYALNLSDIKQAATIDDTIEAWGKSLASRIGHVGDIHVFARANQDPIGPDGATAGTTFLETSGQQLALVKQTNGQSVLIDLEQKVIGTMGTGGSSLHPHPSGNAIVCLNPDGNYLLGVTLDDKDKTGEEPPVFANGKVYWSWGDPNQP